MFDIDITSPNIQAFIQAGPTDAAFKKIFRYSIIIVLLCCVLPALFGANAYYTSIAILPLVLIWFIGYAVLLIWKHGSSNKYIFFNACTFFFASLCLLVVIYKGLYCLDNITPHMINSILICVLILYSIWIFAAAHMVCHSIQRFQGSKSVTGNAAASAALAALATSLFVKNIAKSIPTFVAIIVVGVMMFLFSAFFSVDFRTFRSDFLLTGGLCPAPAFTQRGPRGR